MEYRTKGLHYITLPQEGGEIHYYYLFRVIPMSKPSWMPEEYNDLVILVVGETREDGKTVLHGTLPYRCTTCEVGLAVDFDSAVYFSPYCPKCGKQYENVAVKSGTMYTFASWLSPKEKS